MSFHSSSNDVAGSSRSEKAAVASPKKSSSLRKEETRNKMLEVGDPVKLPFPTKSSSAKKDFGVLSPKKRGRVESDPLELPAPKRSAAADRTLDPFGDSIGNHPEEELRKSRKRAVVEEDSDDEFSVPVSGKSNGRRVNEKSRERAVIEDDSDDEFHVPDSGKSNARRVNEKSRGRAVIEDDSDDEFHVPDSGKSNGRKVNDKSRKRAIIEDDSDDEFHIPDSEKRKVRTARERVPLCKPAATKKTVLGGGPSTSRQVETPLQPFRTNGKSCPTSNGPSGANLSPTTAVCHTPSITEFIDKTMGVGVKKVCLLLRSRFSLLVPKERS